MKKLGKLKLKAEKMLNHQDLLNYRGGSGGSCQTTSGTCATCKEATLYDCEYLGGYTPGSYGFDTCVTGGYDGCCAWAC